MSKHDGIIYSRRYNAIFATASINEAIEGHSLFNEVQKEYLDLDEGFIPLNIYAFSPPAEGNKEKQSQEDLAQEKEDKKQEP